MKKLIFALALVAVMITSVSYADTVIDKKPVTLCTGTKSDGTKVKLIQDGTKTFLVYFDSKGQQTGDITFTEMTKQEFSLWAESHDYRSDC